MKYRFRSDTNSDKVSAQPGLPGSEAQASPGVEPRGESPNWTMQSPSRTRFRGSEATYSKQAPSSIVDGLLMVVVVTEMSSFFLG